MSFKAILYAYILGGFTLVPLLLCALVAYTIYTSEPVLDDPKEKSTSTAENGDAEKKVLDVQDTPKTRKGWLTVRRTFEESSFDGGYVTLVRSFLDARSKDPKRSRPKDMWFVVLKGRILYLYEDESMTDCEAAIQLGSHNVVVYPEGLLDGELFTKRNAICLKPKLEQESMPSLTKEMKLHDDERSERPKEVEKAKKIVDSVAREQALNHQTPWFIFVRSTVEMEDWYLALVHASQHPAQTPTLDGLQDVFSPADMSILVSTLDEQPDIIPMRWFNALFGRIFYSFYKTQYLESFIIGRLMKKLSKVKRPTFLNDILVTEVSVGNRTPVFSKPMLKELTKEGDASMEVHMAFKGEIRITIQATATINLGARFKPYLVKLVLAAVLRELEGNLLIKVKRPPSNRIWYAFTQMPKMVLNVEPVVSDRQITWNMILSTIESSLKTIIQESIVMPNMDDIAFFDTARYKDVIRGGIWADAARKQSKNVATAGEHPSVPNVETTPEPIIPDSEHDNSDPLSRPLQKTSSFQETSSSVPEPPLLVSSSTLPEDASSITNNRRKTWFSSVRGVNMDAESSSDNSNVETESRGRTLGTHATTTPTVRSLSTPNTDIVPEKDSMQEAASSSPSTPPAKTRSVSQSSSARENEGTSDDARTRQSGDGSSLSVPAPSSNTPPSPTNFLATLKSRAADKQALSNTAKDTMRKWGMKWGGLNKNLSGSSSSSSQEDMPDHDTAGEGLGINHSRSRTMSSIGSGASAGSQKARTSYAAVRAAVAERRERAEHGREQSPSGSLTPSSSSTPIPIPPSRNNASQAADFPDHGSLSSNGSSVHPLNGQDSSSYTEKHGAELGRTTSIPQSQPITASKSSSTSSTNSSTCADEPKPSRSRVHLDVPLDEAAPAHAPIHVQPQAKTMSIPGIHASHKGEVMSMGYVPPPAQADNAKDKQRNRTTSQTSSTLSNLSSLGASSMGSLSKNPKLQSMYRLWKQAASNPSSASENDNAHSASTSGVAAENSAADTNDSNPASTSSSGIAEPNSSQSIPALPASMSSLSKRVPPPPLPPRPSPVTITPSRPPPLPARTPSSASGASTPVLSYQTNSPSNSSLTPPQSTSSAHEVLKEIATKDRKRASLTLSSTPPSPTLGRRVSTTSSARSPSPVPVPAQANTITVDEPTKTGLKNSEADTMDVFTSESSLLSEVDATHAWGLDDEEVVPQTIPETTV
ncbi:hypothetical protein F5880DRAFT_1516508 [Lentinula raphanica]|nr:hypothetical protein F5880DRAFT_1516508 [Lentinula raphanica]